MKTQLQMMAVYFTVEDKDITWDLYGGICFSNIASEMFDIGSMNEQDVFTTNESDS